MNGHYEKPELSPVEERGRRTSTPEESILESREKTKSRRLEGGINETNIIELKDDGSAIFKPASGEVEIRIEVQAGTYYKRERAAYLVNRFLNFDFVPPTVIREIDGKIGSVQEFIPDAKMGGEFPMDYNFASHNFNDMVKLFIFDYIIWSSDRNWSNFLIKDNKVYAIDNALSFGNDKTFPQYAMTFFDAPISFEIIEKLRQFRVWEEGKEILRDLLQELIAKNEVDACLRRIEKITDMVKEGIIPGSKKSELSFMPK